MAQEISKTATTLHLDDLRTIRLIFKAASESLSAVEIENLIYSLNYINDSILQEYAPKLVVTSLSRFGHPRLTSRVRPEAALRISAMNYGSPLIMDVIVVAGVVHAYINALAAIAGVTIQLHDRRRGDPADQQYVDPDVVFREETEETLTVHAPTVLIPVAARDDEYLDYPGIPVAASDDEYFKNRLRRPQYDYDLDELRGQRRRAVRWAESITTL